MHTRRVKRLTLGKCEDSPRNVQGKHASLFAIFHKHHGASLLVVGFMLLTAAGCKPTTVVTGEVRFDGKTPFKGEVQLLPANGQGESSAGALVDGHYWLKTSPGRKIVNITIVRSVPYNLSNPNEAALAAAASARGNTSGTYDCVDRDSTNAIGNHIEIEVKQGEQTIDFPLKRR
jgi:hypothetical protein